MPEMPHKMFKKSKEVNKGLMLIIVALVILLIAIIFSPKEEIKDEDYDIYKIEYINGDVDTIKTINVIISAEQTYMYFHEKGKENKTVIPFTNVKKYTQIK